MSGTPSLREQRLFIASALAVWAHEIVADFAPRFSLDSPEWEQLAGLAFELGALSERIKEQEGHE